MSKEKQLNSKEKDKLGDKVRTQMRKGTLDFSVLLIISRGKAYSSVIIESLMKADMIVVEGTLYPLLSRLRRNGLLDYAWEESKSGPPRKYYSLTGKGKETLLNLIKIWEELDLSIKTLIKNYEKSN
ncbi:MAG: PadR family transcriptional regulator PadR [Candidatus Paceibacteria bacterium]|jgi:PadR family transcriptional regulator PadR